MLQGLTIFTRLYMPAHRPTLLALAAATVFLSASAFAQLPKHSLDNGTIHATVTDAIGGRLLSFSLRGRPSFLRVDEKAGDPHARIDANTGNLSYWGHEVWIGPQSQWWAHQSVNQKRAQAKAPWPPDPYLSLSRYTLKSASPAAVVLESPDSPVNGLQLRKRYALVKDAPNSLKLEVEATNRRATDVSWDLWFNTRVRADSQVYVPVAGPGEVRMQPTEGVEPPVFTVKDKLLSLDLPNGPARKGKLFVQPSAGWMAAFHGTQMFLVQFPLQPRAAIHPEQGQIELYHDYQPGHKDQGLLEMEVHAPYLKLAPGRSMQASELWTILPYEGAHTRAAHADFLRRHAKKLGLGGL